MGEQLWEESGFSVINGKIKRLEEKERSLDNPIRKKMSYEKNHCLIGRKPKLSNYRTIGNEN